MDGSEDDLFEYPNELQEEGLSYNIIDDDKSK
jgi:hypothetical protein